MKNLKIIIIAIILFAACKSTNNINDKIDESSKKVTDNIVVNDTTPKVTGIGGIFFFSDNPKKTKEWYAKNLGLETNEWGSTFESRNANHPGEINYLQWSPFKTGNKYFAPSKKDFMINYRVQHIDALVKNLKANGVIVLDTIESYDYGKFVHIMDADSNKIELWEPVDSVLTKIGSKTTK
ncbi:MAG: VOC family protein [Bacteroidetes bacterium]|nr:VOC family protein [Bacteroidota bacterium]